MGHDISAYKIKVNVGEAVVKADMDKEVAYLRFAAWNTVGQYLFYESLDAQHFNSGCSGDGSEEMYTVEQIKTAKEKLKYISSDDSIKGDVKNYSLEDKHNFFKGLMKMFGGNPAEMMSKENEDRIKSEVKSELERINEFYDKIIDCGEEEVCISFY